MSFSQIGGTVGSLIGSGLETIAKLLGGCTPPDINSVIRLQYGAKGYNMTPLVLWQFPAKQVLNSYALQYQAVGLNDSNGDPIQATLLWALLIVDGTVEISNYNVDSLGDLSATMFPESQNPKDAPIYKGPMKKDVSLVNFGFTVTSGPMMVMEEMKHRINSPDVKFPVEQYDRLVFIYKPFTTWNKPQSSPTGTAYAQLFGEFRGWISPDKEGSTAK